MYKQLNPNLQQMPEKVVTNTPKEKNVRAKEASTIVKQSKMLPSLGKQLPSTEKESSPRQPAEQSKSVEECTDESKLKTIIITDHEGFIKEYDKNTSKVFHVNEDSLIGKNFFHLISTY